MLKNVKTRWVSLIESLRRLLSEYCTLIYKMTADLGENAKAEVSISTSFCKFFHKVLCVIVLNRCYMNFSSVSDMVQGGVVR